MATFVDSGIEYVAKLVNGVSTSPFSYMAIGSGTDEEIVEQTSLSSELVDSGLSRVEATRAYESPGKATWYAEFDCVADGKVVNEVGILDSIVDGHMLMRHKYTSPKNLDSGDRLIVSVVFTETRA